MKQDRDINLLDEQANEVPPPIPAFTWMGSLSPLLLRPIALVVAIALLSPDDVLDRCQIARAFTGWMKATWPFISKHADSTSYPQVALLMQCVTLISIPVLSVVRLVQSSVDYPKLLARNRATKQLGLGMHIFLIVLGPPLFLSAVCLLVSLPGDPSWAKGFTIG